MLKYQEHVGITGDMSVGAVIRQDYPNKCFTVNCKGTDLSWFTGKLELMEGGTVGEANRRFAHEKLDEFIDVMLKEQENA